MEFMAPKLVYNLDEPELNLFIRIMRSGHERRREERRSQYQSR